MTIDAYVDMRNLHWGELGHCPVRHCAASLEKVDSQWGEMPYCPVHRIRIHTRSRTFVYSGPDRSSKRDALRNILFERDYFGQHILGHPDKAETHRFCNETSEDAVTWNVFSRLARGGMLSQLVSALTGLPSKSEPELYFWGLRVRLDDSSRPTLFPALKSARDTFEKGIAKFLTEPDVMLYVPDHLLVLVEAKFTSGNAIASGTTKDDVSGQKPKSREGILDRYSRTRLPPDSLLAPEFSEPFYSQLYRELVFAIYMAANLNVKRWSLVNLVSKRQFEREGADLTQWTNECLPEGSRQRFRLFTWEQLYADPIVKAINLQDLAEYMYNKSARGNRAFDV